MHVTKFSKTQYFIYQDLILEVTLLLTPNQLKFKIFGIFDCEGARGGARISRTMCSEYKYYGVGENEKTLKRGLQAKSRIEK